MSNLSDLLPAGGGAKVAEFVASGTLASGQTVALKADGTVEAIAVVPESVGSAVVFEAAASASIASTFDSASNKVVIAYKDAGNSNYGTSIVGTVSGSSISFGTPTIFASTEADNIAATFDSANNKAVIAFRRLTGSDPGRAVVGTVSGTSISFGGQVEFNSGHSRYIAITYDSSSEKVVVAYEDVDNSRYGTAAVGTVSGTSISFGSEAVFSTNVIDDIGIAYDSGANKVVIAYRDNGNNEYGTAIVGTVSGTSISFGTAVAYTNFISRVNSVCYDSTNAKIVIAFHNQSSASYAIVGTVSGTSISFGSSVVFNAAETGDKIGMVYVPTTKQIVITYRDVGNSGYGTLVNATVSGTSISFSSELVFSASSTSSPAPAYTADGKVALAYADSSNYGTSVVYSSVSSNNTDFLGITNEAISNAATGEVAVQGGAITNSSLLPSVFSSSAGSEVVFEAARADHSMSIFDSSNNKVVIIYADNGDSSNGKAIVGTVSGSSISYGTPVTFNAATTTRLSGTFDSNSNKIVIVYNDGGDSNKTKSIVGTVSGTSISFGSEATVTNNITSGTTTTFDSNLNKVVTFYKDDSNNEYGTAAVGTVSGTSISFGTPVVFESAQSVVTQSGSCFDTSNNKTVTVYRDVGNSSHGTAIVGTVSGTSISFGTVTAFHAASTEETLCAFDSGNNKVVVAYRDNAAPKALASRVGTVSGTGISFGTEATVQTISAYITHPAMTYSPDAGRVVIVYSNGDNSTYGTYAIGAVSGTDITYETPVVFAAAATEDCGIAYDTNLDKFVISFKDVDNSNHGTSVVLTVAGAVPALTIGTDYFVQDDGTLSTTSSSVTAGRAIGSTSLLLKG